MQHLDEGTIHSWLDGALSAEEGARVEAHVKECAQCQAAVAEARGLIAASSRILTALDNAPHGVIPAAAPKRRIDTFVWRVAATVLVVAVGTLAVLRSSGSKSSVQETSQAGPASAAAKTGTVSDSAAIADQTAAPTAATQTLEKAAGVATAPTTDGRAANRSAGRLPAATGIRVGEPPPQDSRADVAASAKKNPEPLNAPGLAREGYAAAVPAPSVAAPAAVGARRLALPVVENAALDAANEAWRIRELGPKRAIGEKQTLYEVMPGDTVVLAEQVKPQLQSVVTGASEMRAQSSAAPAREQAAAKVSAPTADTARPTAAPVAAAARVAAPSFPSFTEGANGVNTLSWISTTGNLIKLTGRHTRAELEEIKRRIDRLRAAAAADSSRKYP